jgi:polar amino acid transport system substrate-binding protein
MVSQRGSSLMGAWAKIRVQIALGAGLVSMLMSAHATAGVDVNQVKAKGKLAVATEALYEPFEFVKDGKIVGYGRDILDEIGKDWNVKIEQADLPFGGILTGLLQKKYDLVATTMIINPERVTKYAFTMPIAVTRVAALKKKGDTKVKSLDDLTGLTVGAIVPPAGPTAVLEKLNAKLTEQGKGAAKIVHFQSDPDMVLALANGQIDVAIENQLPLNTIVQKQPTKFEIVGTTGDPFFIGWALRPDDTALRDAINAEIKRLRDSGLLAEFQKKWFGFTMTIPDSGYMPPGAI